MPRYLVTGGAGFIGAPLVESLIRDGIGVCVLDDLSTGRRERLPAGAEFVQQDVTDPRAIRHALEGADGCFHLAGIASVERSRREWRRVHVVNVTGLVTLLDQVGRQQSRSGRRMPVVYASSAAVYGEGGRLPLSEAMPTQPVSGYGADKLACEQYAAVAARLFGVPGIGLRLFNVYGPPQLPRDACPGVVATFIDRLLRGQPMDLCGDGEQVRDFVYLGDAVAAIRRAMAIATTDPIVTNVCTGRGTTIRELGLMLAALAGVAPAFHRQPSAAGDIRISVGHPGRSDELLGLGPKTGLEHGLALTLAGYRQGA
ncbi:MAG: SDR family NAD(P)-dependent oxidoreductase [Alphaproteobacteria bacterium]|nr:SDR family NAD(P)-dependent oxidoreductase [Alphaproteobacteria bacterium]